MQTVVKVQRTLVQTYELPIEDWRQEDGTLPSEQAITAGIKQETVHDILEEALAVVDTEEVVVTETIVIFHAIPDNTYTELFGEESDTASASSTPGL